MPVPAARDPLLPPLRLLNSQETAITNYGDMVPAEGGAPTAVRGGMVARCGVVYAIEYDVGVGVVNIGTIIKNSHVPGCVRIRCV